jgi:D-sedoheptulose 7-phosphate isomerase
VKDWRTRGKIPQHLADFEDRYPDLVKDFLDSALELLIQTVEGGHTLFVCGNGGSAADADHIVGELMKGFLLKRPYPKEVQKDFLIADSDLGKDLTENLQQGIPAISLVSPPGLNSAFANDVNYEMAFAQQVAVLGKPGDLLWGLSTSGNSANVLYAAVAAKSQGMKVLSMTGESGGKLKAYSQVCLAVPEKETFKIQELHLPLYHCLCICLEEYFFGGHE